jgi:hypothetical protein
MSDPDVLRKSVTRDDYVDNPYGGAVGLYFLYPTAYSGPAYSPLPPWWSVQRDFVLRGTVHREAMWADAVFKAITKIAALGWTIEDSEDSQVRVNRGQDIYQSPVAGMHRGWVRFISMHLQDYLLTDNGAFVEIIRASSAAGSRILGLAHLDSARCTRTGDPEIPVLYRDRLGKWHEMQWWQVMTFVDMPDPSETMNGVGHCAASRVFLTLSKLAALEQYMYEKASGDGATEMTFIRGLSQENLNSAIITADGEQKRKGSVYYKGKIVTAILGDSELQDVTIQLKNVPDGFDWKQERDNAYVIYANALGIPVQDIQPLSGQGLGTGTQTIILAEDAEGQGLAAWRKDWLHCQNEYILPTSTTFVWTNQHDTRDQEAKARAKKAQADVIMTLVGNPTAPGVISNAQGLNLAVDWDVVPREFLPETGDATPGGSLGDDEKPIDLSKILPAAVQPPSAPVAPVVPPALPAAKDAKTEALLDEQLDAALALVSRVLSK